MKKEENDLTIKYEVDSFDFLDDYKSIILKFNPLIREVGKYELNLLLCGREEPLDLNVSIIEFSSNRSYYVINNNYNNDAISGLIEGGINGLYIEQYLNNISNSILKDNENGTYSYPIKNRPNNYIGNHTFKFKNYKSSNTLHDIDITINVVEEVNEYFEIIGDVENSCYFVWNFLFNFQIEWINENINHKVILLGPNKTCDNNSCYSLIEELDGYYSISKDSLVDGNLYHILVTENGDTLVPLYSINFILSKITLTEPNIRFFYLNAPYIKLISNCSIDLKGEILKFSRINDNNQISINCNSQTIYNNSDNTITCHFDNKISDDESGYYNLAYNDYIISDKIFLSKAIEDANFKISIPVELKEGINIINITSDNFFLENLKDYYISTTPYDFIFLDYSITEVKDIDTHNNSNSKIYLIVNLNKNIIKYFWRINRNSMEYDNDYGIQYFQNISLEELKVNILSLQFSFDKVYIIEEAKDLCITEDDSYNNITITIISNYDSDIENVENITVKYINEDLQESENDILNKTNNKFVTQYYYVIGSNSNGLKYGIYKFYYGNKVNNKEYPINTYVLVVKKKEHIFKYTLNNSCIFKDYSPNIKISNDIPIYNDFIDLPLIGFLLYDNDNGRFYKYNYNGNNYFLTSNDINELNEFHNYSLIITENDNRNCYIWKQEIKISNSLTINSSFNFFYNDYILFQNVTCIIGNITIKENKNEENEIELSCGEIDKNTNTLQCGSYNLQFENTSYNKYDIYNNGHLIKDKSTIDIYNSILNGTFTVIVPEPFSNSSATQIIIISNNDFDMNKVSEVNIINLDNDEIIQCNKTSTNCSLNNKDNTSLIISPIFSNEKKYYVYTISRELLEFENEGNNTKIINISIQHALIFNVDKTIVVLENCDDMKGNITISIRGNGEDIIRIFTNDSNGNEYNLTKIEKTDNYIFESKIAGHFIFYYQFLSFQNETHKSNIEVQFLKTGINLFNIFHDNNCVYKGQQLFIKINYLNKEIMPQFKAFLNTTELVFEGDGTGDYILTNTPSLDGFYEFIIKDSKNNDNIFYNSTKYKINYTFSNLNNEDYYYIDYIYFTNVTCKFDLLSIKKFPLEDNSESFDLTCNNVENNKIKCDNNTIIDEYGEYSIFYNGTDIGKTTFISNSLSKSIFSLSFESKHDKMEIEFKISSIDFYIKSLDKITIQSTIDDTYIIIKNEQMNFSSDNFSLTFNFTDTKGENYILYLNIKAIEDYPYSLEKTFNEELYFASNFSLIERFKIFTKSEENDIFYINLKFYDNDKTERYISAKNCVFNNKQSKLECKLDNFTQEVRVINYSNNIKYFYIFTTTNTLKKCSEHSTNPTLASIIFYLNTPPQFEKDINISFGDNNDYQCSNSTSNNNNLYVCYAIINTSFENQAVINIDSTTELINLEKDNSIFNDFNFIISNNSSLIENSEDQQLILIFDYEISYKEFHSCKIYNESNLIEGICLQNNKKEINCSFNLTNFFSGDYNLKCESLCSEKIIIIKIKNIICDGYKLRYVINGTAECRYCINIDENKSYYKDGICISKEDCSNYINEGYALIYPDDDVENKRCIKCSEEGKYIENNLCVSKCKAGTIFINNICYLPDDVDAQSYINNMSDKEYCLELCNQRSESCDRELNNCKCGTNFYGIYCEYNSKYNIINSINPMFDQINENFPTNESKFDTTIVIYVKSIIHLL